MRIKVFGIITKKKLKKITDKISKTLTSNKDNIELNSKEIMNNKLLIAELKGMISQINLNKVREQSANNPQTTSKYHKKAKKIADKVQIVSELKKLINKDFSTQEMYEIIVNKKNLCGKTCFYKHLKKVRELKLELREQ